METLEKLRRLRNTKISGTLEEGQCELHDNIIVTWTPAFIDICLCGWNTVTTRRRINQVLEALGSNNRVYSSKGETFVYLGDLPAPRSRLMDDHDKWYSSYRPLKKKAPTVSEAGA